MSRRKRAKQRWGCPSRKVRHPTEEHAIKANAGARRYRCKVCGGWHHASAKLPRQPKVKKWYGVELPEVE